MSEKENKKLIKDFINQVWNKKQLDQIPNFIDKNYKVHTLRSQKTHKGIDFVKNNIITSNKKFPNLKIEIKHMIAEKNLVTSRIILKSKNKTMREFATHKISKGKISEAWSLGSNWD